MGVSLTLTLTVVELVLRFLLFNGDPKWDFLRIPQIYALFHRDGAEDHFNEDFWKLNYIFSGSIGLEDPHPLLGWKGKFTEDYSHYDAHLQGDKRPVLLFGDSFSMCVDSTQCFEDILNSDSAFSENHVLFNYGVGGFGVDQIHLLMNEVVKLYDDPIVIFGLLTTDMDRSMLKFRDAQKPYFELIDDNLVLRGTPISMPTSEYVESNPVEIWSYVINLMLNGWIWVFDEPLRLKWRYVENLQALNREIIEDQLAHLRQSNVEHFGLVFQGVFQKDYEWRNIFIRDLFKELDLPYIAAKDIYRRHKEKTGWDESRYFIPIDRHPNSYYNGLISEAIKAYVLQPEKRDSMDARNVWPTY